MKLNQSDIAQLKAVFNVCRLAGIDKAVITDNKVRGVTVTSKICVLAEVNLSIDPKIIIGVGLLSELEKRLSIFSGDVSIDGKLNDNNEATLLTISAGKSKVQFRCTAERLIKYPKYIDDDAACVITASAEEISQVAKATKMLGAEQLTLAIKRTSDVSFECSSPTNEAFSADLNKPAEFVDEEKSIVHVYEGDRFASVLDAASRDVDELVLTVGGFGSLTFKVKGYTVVVMPNANQEEDDE